MTLDITLLRSFVAVSRHRSISSAAQQVGRTQSAISMQMQRLEAVIGQPLLCRTGAGVALTAAGDRLLEQAGRILAAHDDALDALCGGGVGDGAGGGLRGAISFGCPEDYLAAYFPGLLKEFGARHDRVEIEVVCAPSVELRPLLQRRRLDLALVSVPQEADNPRILRPERFVWVGAHPTPDCLSRTVVPLALSAPGTLDHEAAITAMEQAGRAYRIAFASNSLAGLLAVTRSGQAISVVTRSAVPPDLSVLGQGVPALPDIGISLAYASPRPSRVVQAFGAMVEEHLRQDGREVCSGGM